MKGPQYPITDHHIHIDPRNGRGLDAAKDFQRSGGTHLFLVSKPTSSFGIFPTGGEDFLPVFQETLSVSRMIADLGIHVYPILGVHPAEITRLSESLPLPRAVEIMKEGIALASRFIADGSAVGLKSGRPHYEVPQEVWDAANDVLSFSFQVAADCDCAVQIHAESGSCDDMREMAAAAGLSPDRVVKHYAIPETSLVPSFLATHPEIPALARDGRNFLMESDYMDELSRPGAVIGPRSVPRMTRKLLEGGEIDENAVERIHVLTPSRVYGIDIVL